MSRDFFSKCALVPFTCLRATSPMVFPQIIATTEIMSSQVSSESRYENSYWTQNIRPCRGSSLGCPRFLLISQPSVNSPTARQGSARLKLLKTVRCIRYRYLLFWLWDGLSKCTFNIVSLLRWDSGVFRWRVEDKKCPADVPNRDNDPSHVVDVLPR